MSDLLQSLLTPPGLESTAFEPTSRYHGINTGTAETTSGEVKVYVKRRFIAAQENFSLLQIHRIEQGDRLDNLAHQYLGDPQQYWRLCDANGVMQPDELTDTMGKEVRITLPEGIPGGDDA